MRVSTGFSSVLLCLGFALIGPRAAWTQSSATPLPVTFIWPIRTIRTSMDHLEGIKALGPGLGGNEKAPNHANYDESKANPYPNLPDPLTLNDGRKVTTAQMWTDKRRPEIVDMVEKYVYGRIPKEVPKVTWHVIAVDHEMIGFNRVIAKDLIGEVDNSSYPAISVKIHMTVVTPANAAGPVPLLIMFGRAGFPFSQRARGRRSRPRQRSVESAPHAAGSFAVERCVCQPPGMAAGQSNALSSFLQLNGRRRPTQHMGADRSGLGIRDARPGERAGR